MAEATTGIVGAVTRRGLFYGWIVVAVCFVMQMLSSISFQGLSTYVVPFEREFGWSRTTIGVGRSFQQLDAAFGPLNGALADRIGTRRMFIIGTALYVLGLASFSRIDSVWSYYAASALMAIANAFCGLLVVSIAINHWFHRTRTTALGYSVLGFAVAGAIFVPAIVLAEAAFGWRQAALLSALGILLVAAPAALLMRDAPERHGLLPDGERPGPIASAGVAARSLADFTLREALYSRAFWLIAFGGATAFMAQGGVIVYHFAHIEGVISRESAALTLVALNLFNIAGRILGGYLGDRFSKHVLLGLDLAGTAASIVILVLAESLPAFVVYGALFGFFWGVRTPLISSLQAEYFGRRHFGRIAGTLQTIALPLTLAVPVVSGLVADAQQDYRPAFVGAAVLAALSSALYFLAIRPRKPAAALGV